MERLSTETTAEAEGDDSGSDHGGCARVLGQRVLDSVGGLAAHAGEHVRLSVEGNGYGGVNE